MIGEETVKSIRQQSGHLDLLCLALNLRRLDVLTRSHEPGLAAPNRGRPSSGPAPSGHRPGISPKNDPATVDRPSIKPFAEVSLTHDHAALVLAMAFGGGILMPLG